MFTTIPCRKKGKSYCVDSNKNDTPCFSKWLYVKKNIFSSESIYFFIHSFITALLFSLSVGLICPFPVFPSVLIGISAGLLLFLLLSIKYFQESIRVYGVLIDETNSAFNWTFSKAWFLHFYL